MFKTIVKVLHTHTFVLQSRITKTHLFLSDCCLFIYLFIYYFLELWNKCQIFGFGSAPPISSLGFLFIYSRNNVNEMKCWKRSVAQFCSTDLTDLSVHINRSNLLFIEITMAMRKQSAVLVGQHLVMWLFFWLRCTSVDSVFQAGKGNMWCFLSHGLPLSCCSQSTSNVWMTHAEMESLNAATKPPVSPPRLSRLRLTKPSFMFFMIAFELF